MRVSSPKSKVQQRIVSKMKEYLGCGSGGDFKNFLKVAALPEVSGASVAPERDLYSPISEQIMIGVGSEPLFQVVIWAGGLHRLRPDERKNEKILAWLFHEDR